MQRNQSPDGEGVTPRITILHANEWVKDRHDLAFIKPLVDGLLRRREDRPGYAASSLRQPSPPSKGKGPE